MPPSVDPAGDGHTGLPSGMGRPVFLMLDYDGTLAPIVPDFTQAFPAPGIESLLVRLSQAPHVQVAVVSGRSVDQLLGFLPGLAGHAIWLVGLHGGQVYNLQTQTMVQAPSEDLVEAIRQLKTHLEAQGIAALPGVKLEDKRYSLGVHYRQAPPEAARQAVTTLSEAVEPLGLTGRFLLRPGKMLLEAVPAGFNKGAGVQALMGLAAQTGNNGSESPLPVYVGDDVTDFDAFRVVRPMGGLCVYVGEQNLPLEAPPIDGRLASVTAVVDWLSEFTQTAPALPPLPQAEVLSI